MPLRRLSSACALPCDVCCGVRERRVTNVVGGIRTLEEQDDDAGDAALEEFKAVASVLSGCESTSPDFVIGYVADLVKCVWLRSWARCVA